MCVCVCTTYKVVSLLLVNVAFGHLPPIIRHANLVSFIHPCYPKTRITFWNSPLIKHLSLDHCFYPDIQEHAHIHGQQTWKLHLQLLFQITQRYNAKLYYFIDQLNLEHFAKNCFFHLPSSILYSDQNLNEEWEVSAKFCAGPWRPWAPHGGRRWLLGLARGPRQGTGSRSFFSLAASGFFTTNRPLAVPHTRQGIPIYKKGINVNYSSDSPEGGVLMGR